MVRLGTISSDGSGASAMLTCLLAGLVLVATVPAPAALHETCGDTQSVPSEGDDPLPDDTEMPEVETAAGDFAYAPPSRRRSALVSGPDSSPAPRILWPWTVLAASRSRPCWLIQFDAGVGRAGHFLAEGRPLLFWVQMQTC
jgi:hypothetical protein